MWAHAPHIPPKPPLPSSHVSSHTRWRSPPGSSREPNRRRQCVCVCVCVCVCEAAPPVCLWVCAHTWAKLRRGDLARLCFSFYIISSPPSLPPSLPLLPSLALLAQSVSSIHLLPALLSPSLSPSVGEVNAGSLQCSERVQHQECVSGDWLTACDLTNKKEATAAMFPLHNQ